MAPSRPRDVDARDDDVGLAAARRVEDRAPHGHGIARVGGDDGAAHAEGPELRRRAGVGLDAHDASAGPRPSARFGRAQHAALAAGAEDHHRLPGLDQARDLRRRAGDVERGQGHALGQVGREPGDRAAGEDHRLALHIDLRARRACRDDGVDPQGCERKRHERGHAVARPRIVRQSVPSRGHLEHAAEQHPARTGDGIVLLAAVTDRA